MGIMCNLAMSAAEILRFSPDCAKVAWMSCHFSPYGTGLSNLPYTLADDALLILDDSTQPSRHDSARIVAQLSQIVSDFSCSGVLMDFERPPTMESVSIVHALVQSLSCPVAVPPAYAKEEKCAVFLPSIPPDVAIESQIEAWKDREVWLEVAREGCTITLSPSGAIYEFNTEEKELPYQDDKLLCHYAVRVTQQCAIFQLSRTAEDLRALFHRAEALGVTRIVGIYRELADMFPI